MPDTWKNREVVYTIDAKENTGGVITAQKVRETKVYSRIVKKPVTREEAEKLFETDLAK
jgi:hypothetical protein